MAKMEWQEKINLDKLDEGARDYLLALLLENRELRKTAEKERESRLSWYKRCEELEDRISCRVAAIPPQAKRARFAVP